MANEVTVPLLPCRSIDEIVELYGMLGFERTRLTLVCVHAEFGPDHTRDNDSRHVHVLSRGLRVH